MDKFEKKNMKVDKSYQDNTISIWRSCVKVARL